MGETQALLKEPATCEAIEGHLAPPIATERAAVLMERLRVMAGEQAPKEVAAGVCPRLLQKSLHRCLGARLE